MNPQSFDKPDFYNQKIIYTYNKIEKFQYSRHVICNKPRTFKKKRVFCSKTPSAYNLNQTKHKIRRLVNCNLSTLTKFLTLTFAEHITDLKESNLFFKKFILRLSYKFPDLKYIAVPEFTKIGRVHYHILLNLPFVPQKELEKIWSHGIVFIESIDKMDDLGLYISKYISKFESLPQYRGKKKYFHSKNLLTPIFYYNNDVDLLMSQITIKSFDYKSDFFSPFVGTIDFETYSV